MCYVLHVRLWFVFKLDLPLLVKESGGQPSYIHACKLRLENLNKIVNPVLEIRKKRYFFRHASFKIVHGCLIKNKNHIFGAALSRDHDKLFSFIYFTYYIYFKISPPFSCLIHLTHNPVHNVSILTFNENPFAYVKVAVNTHVL